MDKADEFKTEERLKVTVTGKGLEVTPAIKQHIYERLEKIEDITPHLIEAHIYLGIQKTEHRCEILYTFSHFQVRAEARSTDLYASIEQAHARLKTKLKKWKSKILDYHKKTPKMSELPVSILSQKKNEVEEINAEIEEENLSLLMEMQAPHHIVAETTRPLKTLTTSEAIMKMELSNDPFMVFKGEEDLKLKAIYLRRDENFGLIELQ
jgi:putative sigma-54 modulation protein